MRERVCTVKAVLKEAFTGGIRLCDNDDRFRCANCDADIHGKMYVDDQQDIWCTTCWSRGIERTVRNLEKNPEDTHHKYLHPGGTYYQRLIDPAEKE